MGWEGVGGGEEVLGEDSSEASDIAVEVKKNLKKCSHKIEGRRSLKTCTV